jgi:hypothetical protein
LTASSHLPYGHPLPGPTPRPVPLQSVPAMPAAVASAPAPTAAGTPEPAFPMCVLCGNRRDLVPRNQERYRSGARVLVCRGGCTITPVQAATGVITAAMTNGAGTPQEWAQAEEDAGLLFDPQAAKDIESAARAQERAAMRAELGQAQQDAEALAWFHARWLAAGRLCEGRLPADVLRVAEVVTALDGRAPAMLPLTLTWDGVIAPPAGDGPGETTLVGCTTARGGRAVLALSDDQRADLGARLLDTVHPAEACVTPGCGISADDLDTADPKVWGWIRVDVAGAESGPRWWCTPSCATAAMAAAGAELAAADQLAAITPATDAAAVEDYVARCARCGCTEDRACQGGCHWIPNTQLIKLCSACATPQELEFAAYAASKDGQEETP